jgi:hypothetical protein
LPNQTEVWGDNLQSDVGAALEAGVPPENIILIRSQSKLGNQGEIPEAVLSANSLLNAIILRAQS